MLHYSLSPTVEAFSTNCDDAIDFEVILPAHQAHSDRVRRIPQEQDDITGVDALITNERGVRIGVKTADCVPILLYDSRREAIADSHSVWKGTVKNIIRSAIARMTDEFHTASADILAVIGPCIHLEAFEVGEEVYDMFKEDYPSLSFPANREGAKCHIDLPGICRQQLIDCGVNDSNIEVRPECTWTLHDRFFSARRLGKQFDRQRIINAVKLL